MRRSKGCPHGDLSRFIYREAFVPAGQPPEQQAELISESVKRKVHAMIVAPADPAAIGSSLAEARDQGIAVVSIGPEISGLDRPLPRIDLSPIEPLARRTHRAGPEGRQEIARDRQLIPSGDRAEGHTARGGGSRILHRHSRPP